MPHHPTRRDFIRTTVVGGAALAMGVGCDEVAEIEAKLRAV